MSSKKSTVTVAALAAAGALVAGGVAVANAATTAPAPTSSGTAGYGAPGDGQQGQQGQQDGQGGHREHHAPGTAATAAQTAQVKAAVTAKDSTVAVQEVRVDQDGSFHARATKAGQPVHVRVSTDLKTITIDTRGPGGHGEHGGPGGGGRDAAATAAQAAQVKAAVTAKDSAITVTEVRVDPDGSYDALGTKAGRRVMVEVSKDLKTVEVRTGGPRGEHGDRGQGGPGQQGQQGGTQTAPSGYSA